MIRFINVSKKHHDSYIVKNLSFEIATGETLVILGASGSGKTTTLKLINRLIEPTEGTILINNQDIMSINPVLLRRKMGYVFQDIGLFPHMSIEDNISIILRFEGIVHSERQAIARKLLTDCRLDPDIFAKRFPFQLSGGQQQRVGVARALATNPDFLLMDEPFGALDAIYRFELQNELLSIKQKFKKTIIFVTHDIFEAIRLADRIAIMKDGSLEQIGTKEDMINNPASPFVAELFGKAKDQIKEFKSLFYE